MFHRLFTRAPSENELQGWLQTLTGTLVPVTAPFPIPAKCIIRLCRAARQFFLQEASLLQLQLEGGITLVGDLHGQHEDLLAIINGVDLKSRRYLFMGDYVDRGARGLEVALTLFCLKLLYPKQVYLLRGNHECSGVNLVYGFYRECKQRSTLDVWEAVNHAFDALPFAATLGSTIFAVHGGLSFHLYKVGQIKSISRPVDMSAHSDGLLCDLLWSDPATFKPGFQGWARNPRGQGYVFGTEAVEEFLELNKLTLIVRSHQCVQDGVEFYGKDRNLVTVFSAPNYCGGTNAGAVMHVQEDGSYTFQFFNDSLAPAVSLERPSPVHQQLLQESQLTPSPVHEVHTVSVSAP